MSEQAQAPQQEVDADGEEQELRNRQEEERAFRATLFPSMGDGFQKVDSFVGQANELRRRVEAHQLDVGGAETNLNSINSRISNHKEARYDKMDGLGERPKGVTLGNLEDWAARINYCTQAQRLRDRIISSKADEKTWQAELVTRKSRLADSMAALANSNEEEPSITVEGFNEECKILPVDLELKGMYRKIDGRYNRHFFYFRIGEHVLRPHKSSKDRNSFTRQAYEQGIMRPPINFVIAFSSPTSGSGRSNISLGVSYHCPENRENDVFRMEGTGELKSEYDARHSNGNENYISSDTALPHPHSRISYYREEPTSFGETCLGSYSGQLKSALLKTNPLQLGDLLVSFWQRCDANDAYGRSVYTIFSDKDLIPKEVLVEAIENVSDEAADFVVPQEQGLIADHPDNEHWIPIMVYKDGTIKFLNKPDGFEYCYSLEVTYSNGSLGSFESCTDVEPPNLLENVPSGVEPMSLLVSTRQGETCRVSINNTGDQ